MLFLLVEEPVCTFWEQQFSQFEKKN